MEIVNYHIRVSVYTAFAAKFLLIGCVHVHFRHCFPYQCNTCPHVSLLYFCHDTLNEVEKFFILLKSMRRFRLKIT